jgi:alpha-N-arabinofuranosidase
VFILNRSLDEDLETEIVVSGAKGLIEHIVLENGDLKVTNSLSDQNVEPCVNNETKLDGETVKTVIKRASWNVVRLKNK